MRIIDSFIDDKKGFLKDIVKIDKGFDYYLGLVIDMIDDYSAVQEKCVEIYEKSGKNVKLLKVCDIDSNKLLIFEINSSFVIKGLNGVLLSISKYLKIEKYTTSYMKTLQSMIFNSWEEQYYFTLKDGEKEYDLRILRE